MADGKKGFLLYADQIGIFEKLIEKDRKDGTNYAGELAFHIFQYVNDRDPAPPDFIIEMAFEPIKTQLKRDLKKYDQTKDINSEKGAIGNLKRWNPDLYDQFIKKEIDLSKALEIAESRSGDKQRQKSSPNVAKIADNDNVKVNDKDKILEDKQQILKLRKQKFADTLEPFVEKYGKDLLNAFYKYWTEPNKSLTKLRWEIEKTWEIGLRIENWAKRDKNFQTTGNADSTANMYKKNEIL